MLRSCTGTQGAVHDQHTFSVVLASHQRQSQMRRPMIPADSRVVPVAFIAEKLLLVHSPAMVASLLCAHYAAVGDGHTSTVVVRRNARLGRHAAENLIAAARAVYDRAIADDLIDPRSSTATAGCDLGGGS